MKTLSWPEYLYGFAEHAAKKSKDVTQVGAALVSSGSKRVLMTAYNGPPQRVRDTEERRERPAKYLFVAHAEQNLVSFCAEEGVSMRDKIVYVTHFPCSRCASMLIQAGVSKVVYGPGKTSMPPEEFQAARDMFVEAGVTLVEH